MNLKNYLLITAFACFAFTLPAQDTIRSVQEATKYAREHNRDAQIAKQKIAIEHQNVKGTNSLLVPQVKATSDLAYNYALPTQLVPAEFFGGQPGEYLKVQFGTKYNWTAGLEASMPLINTSYWMDMKSANLNEQLSEYQYQQSVHELDKQISKGYYLVLISQTNAKISEKNFQVADSLLRIAEQRKAQGLIEPLDYNRIKTSYLSSRSVYEQNQAVWQKNYNALKYNLGVEQSREIFITEKIETVQEQTQVNLQSNINSYPGIRMRETQLSVYTVQWKKDKWKRMPEISLYGRYSQQAQRNDFNFFGSNSTWFTLGAVGARLDMPIFTGFTRQSAINRSRMRMEIAQKELENEREKSAQEDRELQLNYQQSSKALTDYQDAYQLSEENIRIAMLKYQQGLYSLDQYLNVYNESLNIQNQYLRYLSDVFIYRSMIELKNSLPQ